MSCICGLTLLRYCLRVIKDGCNGLIFRCLFWDWVNVLGKIFVVLNQSSSLIVQNRLAIRPCKIHLYAILLLDLSLLERRHVSRRSY